MARRAAPTTNRRKKIGRPPVCTPETIAALEAVLKLPLRITDAVELAGVERSLFYKWQERAHEELAARANDENPPTRAQQERRDNEQRYCDFLDMLTRGELEMKQALIERIHQAGQPRKVRTQSMRREPLRESGKLVRDADGAIVYKTTETVTETDEEGDWRAPFELLRRRFHDEWGDRTRAEHTGAGGGPIRMEIPAQSLDAEAVAELRAAMLESGLVTDEGSTE